MSNVIPFPMKPKKFDLPTAVTSFMRHCLETDWSDQPARLEFVMSDFEQRVAQIFKAGDPSAIVNALYVIVALERDLYEARRGLEQQQR